MTPKQAAQKGFESISGSSDQCRATAEYIAWIHNRKATGDRIKHMDEIKEHLDELFSGKPSPAPEAEETNEQLPKVES